MYSHGEAVIHETQGCWSHHTANVIRYGRCLVQRPKFVDGTDGFFLTPRTATGKHFQDNTAQRPDIDLGRVTLAPIVISTTILVREANRLCLGSNDLGRHPEDGALHAVRDIVVVWVRASLGDSEIRDFARAIQVEEDIVSFEVSMKNSLAVQVGQSAKGLSSQTADH